MRVSREALVIATGNYDDPELRRLRAPAQDAEALSRVLTNPAIGGFNVKTVVDQTSRVITQAAQQFFSDRGLDDLLLLHLSCHGVKDDDGRLYFAASDTERDWLASTGVSAAFINDLIDRSRARSIVLLLDCCYSGAFVAGSKGDDGVHLKEKFVGEGRVILTASNAIEYSWEGDDLSGEGAPSLFTAAIVQGLETGEADRDHDGMISADDLYKHVYERVRAERSSQTPKMWALGIEHDVYLAKNPRPVELLAAALPPQLQAALESPLPSVRVAVVEDLAQLLRSTVPGLNLAAQNALEQLWNDDSNRVSQAAREASGVQDSRGVGTAWTTLDSDQLEHRHQAEEVPHPEKSKRNVGEQAKSNEPARPQSSDGPARGTHLPPIIETGKATVKMREPEQMQLLIVQALRTGEHLISMFSIGRKYGVNVLLPDLLGLTETSVVIVSDRGRLKFAPEVVRMDYSQIRHVESKYSLRWSGWDVLVVHRDPSTNESKTDSLGVANKSFAQTIASHIQRQLR